MSATRSSEHSPNDSGRKTPVVRGPLVFVVLFALCAAVIGVIYWGIQSGKL